MGAPCRLGAEARLRSRCQLSLTPPLPLADLTAFGHPGGGMDMENLAETLKGNPMLQQAMADNPEMQELLNNPAALQEKMAAAQAAHSAHRCTLSRPGPRFTQRPPRRLPAPPGQYGPAASPPVAGSGRALLCTWHIGPEEPGRLVSPRVVHHLAEQRRMKPPHRRTASVGPRRRRCSS